MVDPPPIGFGPQVCGDLDAGATREWVVPDGLGGYAMGTVSGLRTRRYHALLVVSSGPSRHVGLVALDPVVTLPSGAIVRLGTHEWATGAVAPDGYRFLERFDLVNGLPRWRWRIGDVVVSRELAMIHGSPSVGVVHRLVSGTATLTLEALCTWRDAHGSRGAGGGDLRMAATADGVVIDGAYRLAGPGWRPAGEWYRAAFTRDEAERGLTAVEDLWYAGSFATADVLEVSAWAGDLAVRPPPASEVVAAAHRRARAVLATAKPSDGTGAALALAADAFVISGHSGPDVVAGYPWFGAWSRDTMTSYEGLFLSTGRFAEGRDLLRAYAATLSEGMLANTADTGRTEYNTVDATLWFLHAVERHVVVTGDLDLAAALVPALDAIVAAHLAGTRYGIRVDADGLISQGAPGYALTWMDARVDGVAITPRTGKPVEINALWVSGLAGLGSLRTRLGLDDRAVTALHDGAKASFRRRFPAPTGWLHDVVDGPAGAAPPRSPEGRVPASPAPVPGHAGRSPAGEDASLRPNQLLAWSLPRAPMSSPVPAAVGAHLLTPLGLRSLSPADPAYRGRHRGGPAERDAAYHQGTVWPWLIGPYADAVPAGSASLLAGIDAHLAEYGVGSVSETADGEAPHRATGCPFQAWSVAEVLRVHRKI
jgi:predicted glycogen debranching enzyme